MEDIFFAVIPLLILLGVIAAVVYAVLALTRRNSDFSEADPGIGTVRRLYFYGVSFVALLMVANGIGQIGEFILNELFAGVAITTTRVKLAVGLSLTLVGLPLFALHWWFIGKYVRELPVEAKSVLRKVYLYGVMGASFAAGVGAALKVLHWALRAEVDFDGDPWAGVVVWSVVWILHWRIETREGQATPETLAVRRLYVYVVSSALLIMAAVGLGQTIHAILREAYISLTAVTVLGKSGLWQTSTRQAVSLLLVGGVAWGAHWAYFARGDYRSTVRQLYLYVLGIFGGISTVLAALGVIVYGVLQWTIGVPEENTAAAHFRVVPGAVASIIVGGSVLVFHVLVAGRDSLETAIEARGARRSYPYALAALGLVVMSVGIATLATVAVGSVAEAGGTTLTGQGQARNAIALSITLGLLGAPLWGYYWRTIQRRAGSNIEELAGLPRRVFTFGALGVGTLAFVISLSVLVFVFFRELLDGDLGNILRDAKVSIGVMVPAVIFVPYYWMVYMADRKEVGARTPAEEPRPRKAVTVLASEAGMAFVRGLEEALGYGVSPLNWADADAVSPELDEGEVERLAQRIGDAAGLNVLVIPEGASVRILSYE